MDFSRKHLIYGAIMFVSLLGAMAKLTFFDGSQERGPLGFLLSMFYLAFLVWSYGQLRAIHLQEQEDGGKFPAGSPDFFLSAEIRPSEDALISADMYLSVGESLETICRFVEPRYSDWTPSERQKYRQGMRAALDARRSNPPAEEQTADG